MNEWKLTDLWCLTFDTKGKQNSWGTIADMHLSITNKAIVCGKKIK